MKSLEGMSPERGKELFRRMREVVDNDNPAIKKQVEKDLLDVLNMSKQRPEDSLEPDDKILEPIKSSIPGKPINERSGTDTEQVNIPKTSLEAMHYWQQQKEREEDERNEKK